MKTNLSKILVFMGLIVFLSGIGLTFVHAQTDADLYPNGVPSTNPPAQGMSDQDRMLAAFDNPNAIKGTLIVSFDPDATEDMAKQILSAYGLSIDYHQVCATGSVANPGSTPTTQDPSCTTEGWNDSLKTAQVKVTEGQEKTIALQLFNDDLIAWVEPSYTASIADNGGGKPIPTPYENADDMTKIPPESVNLGNDMLYPPAQANPWIPLAGGLVVLGVAAYFLTRKR